MSRSVVLSRFCHVVNLVSCQLKSSHLSIAVIRRSSQCRIVRRSSQVKLCLHYHECTAHTYHSVTVCVMVSVILHLRVRAIALEIMFMKLQLCHKTRKKKLPRPCVFCKTFPTNLHRHLILKHRTDKAVQEALRKPAPGRLEAFAQLQKEGIFRHNKKEMRKEKPVCECERTQSRRKNLVQCSKC